MVVAIVLPDHDGQLVKPLVTSLKFKGWKISHTDISFPEQGNTIAGASHVIIGVHSSCAFTVKSLVFKEPPSTSPHPIGLSIWEPINRPEHLVSLDKDDLNFCCQDI
jgi:hypothetical protein